MSNLFANWPAPSNICALTTTRISGHSLPPYDANNLALHVGDEVDCVIANRHALMQKEKLPNDPFWLEQTHSTNCVVVEDEPNCHVDAAITRKKSNVLCILTADCLPIVLCDKAGTEIAAIHAGWRGLVGGIIEKTLAKMLASKNSLMAWIGPAICQNCYEVGSEVKDAYTDKYPYTIPTFIHRQETRSYANLPKMAELILNANGVQDVYQSAKCTFEHHHEFYSYRRAPQTGRMATLIWFKQDN